MLMGACVPVCMCVCVCVSVDTMCISRETVICHRSTLSPQVLHD